MPGINPLYTTETGLMWKCTLQNDSEAADPLFPNIAATYPATDLTGLSFSNLTAYFKPTNGAASFTGQGTFSILSVKNPAIVQYAPAAADVATAGQYTFFIIVAYPAGPVFYGPYGPFSIIQK